jgi:hypothetical protein
LNKKKNPVHRLPIVIKSKEMSFPFILAEEFERQMRKVTDSNWLAENEKTLLELSTFAPPMKLAEEIKPLSFNPEKKTKVNSKTPDNMADTKQGGCHDTEGLAGRSTKQNKAGRQGNS